MSTPENAVPDTQLGLISDEIALLRYHQQKAAASTAGGSSSLAVSRASSQGLLLLDSSALRALGLHFEQLLQQVMARLDYLSEQSQMVAQQQYDRAGNAIAIADEEIARFHDILRQIEELEEGDFDRMRHIRDIVRGYEQRVWDAEWERDHPGETIPRRRRHGAYHGSSRRHSSGQRQKEVEDNSSITLEHLAQPIPNQSEGRQSRAAEAEGNKAQKKPIELHYCKDCTHAPFENPNSLEGHRKVEHANSFICVFNFAGCEGKFASRNKWESHVTYHHLDFYRWVCDIEACRNIFYLSENGNLVLKSREFEQKDIFTEHFRRMHMPFSSKGKEKGNQEWEERLKEIQINCRRGTRDPPTKISCPNCRANFQGVNSWDKMIDHLGGGCKESDWPGGIFELLGTEGLESNPFVHWALQEKIIERGLGSRYRLCGVKNDIEQGSDLFQESIKMDSTLYNHIGPFSDSGYASMGWNQDFLLVEGDDDTRTVCTDDQELNIEEESKEKLASTFSKETLQRLSSTLLKWDSKRQMGKPLVDLLKEFSIRLQCGAKPGHQKDTSVFVRHYR
jgi:hypothetical protein